MLIENTLLINTCKEFNNKTIRYFFDRLRLFLLVNRDVPVPKVVFTSNKNTINKYLSGKVQNRTLAFYDHESNTIVFDANYYKIAGNDFEYDVEDFMTGYKYAIPLSTVYHELIHHVQFHLGTYGIDPVLEGSAEILAYILTGQDDIVYTQETTALWYIARKILKYNVINFYMFITEIVKDDHKIKLRCFGNPKVTEIVADKYNFDWPKLFKNIGKEFGNEENVETMKKDLNELHSLIFYKY